MSTSEVVTKRVYPEEETFENLSKKLHPPNQVDYRSEGGPLLTYLWCSSDDPLTGQSLYLGGEVGCDGNIYCIPGHANKVLQIDVKTDKVRQIGPRLESNGTKFKWLRGITIGDVIYGLPCHACDILRIHVPTLAVTKIPIPYFDFYKSPEEAKSEKERLWKYHGGSISPIDGCIYAVPQSATHVCKVDPKTDTCSLVGPRLPGKYKWYGGIVGKQDQAIYCVPHDSHGVLRITPKSITIHGDYGTGGHKWHGAAAADNGVIVCVPANADTVLTITPQTDSNEPLLQQIGNNEQIQTGRHRFDKKYKYLGAMTGPNGRDVYIFPSGSEYVLQVNTYTMTTSNVGPNLYDNKMERVCQNKWQNGLTCPQDQCVYAIPLAGESLLRIDCSNTNNNNNNDNNKNQEKSDPIVTTWLLPSPHKGLAKWEGGTLLTDSGIMYTVPNNHKAVLRIEPPCIGKTPINDTKMIASSENSNANDNDNDNNTSNKFDNNNNDMTNGDETINSGDKSNNNKTSNDSATTTSTTSHNVSKNIASRQEYEQNKEDLKYRSGIPTLRSSAHRVKFAPKSRKHDPKPKDAFGNETNTTWLPGLLLEPNVFAYNQDYLHQLQTTLIDILQACDDDIVGTFRDCNNPRLEDFQVPVNSVWRSVNGGCCEDAQQYLSNAIATNDAFLKAFDMLVEDIVLPYIKQQLMNATKIMAKANTNNNNDNSNQDCATEKEEKGNEKDDDHDTTTTNNKSPADNNVDSINDDSNNSITFYYQRPPTIRLQPGPGWAKVKPHDDAEYGHQNGEVNFWIPLTDRKETGVDLWCESQPKLGDYAPIVAHVGEIISFHGSSRRHYVNSNGTESTRVSMDFRIGVQGYFDPYWQMQGTTHDHGRQEVTL